MALLVVIYYGALLLSICKTSAGQLLLDGHSLGKSICENGVNLVAVALITLPQPREKLGTVSSLQNMVRVRDCPKES
jgi:hypothetical protein